MTPKLLTILLVLAFCLVAVQSYAVDYYVCVTPDGSNPGGGYDKSHSSLAGAFNTVEANLVAGNTRYFIHIIGDWSGVTDITQATLQGKTTDGNYYVDVSCPTAALGGVTVSARHSGKVTAGAYTLFNATDDYAVKVEADYTRLHGLQVRKIGASASSSAIQIGSSVGGNDGDETHVYDNVVYSEGGTSPNYLIHSAGFTASGTHYIYNNIVYGKATVAAINHGAWGGGPWPGVTRFAIHNTVAGAAVGYAVGARSYLYNNIAQVCTNGYLGPLIVNGGYNISDLSGDTFFATDKVCTATFVDLTASSGVTDLHLSGNDSCATGYATDMSGTTSPYRTLDIDGEAMDAAYDVGADECLLGYVPPPPTPPPSAASPYDSQGRRFLWGVETITPQNEYAQRSNLWVSAVDSTVDTGAPLSGYHYSMFTYSAPPEWSAEVVQRWDSLRREGSSEYDRETVNTWGREVIPISTPWIQGKNDKTNAFLDLSVTNFSHFTVFSIEPPLGTVEQNFQGRARIYGLDESQEYIVRCYDADGVVGSAYTTLSDKYIRTLPAGIDAWTGVRSPIMVKALVEDPNQDIWAATYEPAFDGSTYQFINVYWIDSKTGRPGAEFSVPLRTNNLATWNVGLYRESDGDVVVAAGEEPVVLGTYTIGFTGPSYIARVETNGETVWESDKYNLSTVYSVDRCASGYVYAGYALMRSGTTGVMENWGYTGTTSVYPPFIMRDVEVSYSGTTVASSGVSGMLDDLAGGACATDFDAGACGNAFDQNDATSVDEVQADDNTTSWDFGAGNGQAPATVYIHAYTDRVLAVTGVTFYVEYSDDGAAWTELGHIHSFAPADHQQTWPYGGATKRYWRVRVDGESAILTSHKLYEVKMSGPLASAGGDVYPELATVCGGSYLYGTKATGKYGGNASDIGMLEDAIYAFDDSTYTFTATGGGVAVATVNWTFNSSVTPTYGSAYVWNSGVANITGTLEYYSPGGGGVWVANSAAQSWGAGVTSFLDFPTTALTGATAWRMYFTGGGPNIAFRMYDFGIFDSAQQAHPTVAQFYLTSGVTIGGTQDMQGQMVWSTAMSGETGYFTSMTTGARDGAYYCVGTDSYISDTDLSAAKGIAGSISVTGTTQWFKTYPEVSVFYDVAPCSDGGFVMTGTKYSSGVTVARQAVVVKIDHNGNVDSKFPQVYNEGTALGSDGRAILETLEGGILMGGGSSDNNNLSSKPYFVKLDRFYDCCSTGDACE